ncbi:Cof-type HAD-IIB family hydrolase [Sporolactobacillus shoreicorticis]|uniref:Cof-type HAD-IIB family hydrolase n=1 Tax=Sporolactobacillus shoreicorticis TaxID=1923877 RepID=A0ABW5S579_9BACL|nr:Cof-type HAD-IIB family hydrolase [Sporolactobacillus shoreicorticis]MCO7124395.1 Cof-type HAD-IIB family hydrolase [Sporolactobacillus shoreicorticis]
MKLAAIDLDGTLLNKDQVISPENMKALAAASEHHIVTIATGRAIMDVQAMLRNEVHLPVIASNGATIFDRSGRLLDEEPLPQDAAETLIAYAEHHHLYYEVTVEHDLLAPPDGKMILRKELDQSEEHQETAQKARARAEVQFNQAGWKPQAEISRFIHRGCSVYKLLIFSFNNHVLADFKEHFADRTDIACTNSVGYTAEFNSSKSNKGKAIRQLAKRYGIHQKDTIVIGDSHNDLPMFRAAATQVAMGNAIPSIKEISFYVTLDCNHDGVAYSLKHQLALF